MKINDRDKYLSFDPKAENWLWQSAPPKCHWERICFHLDSKKETNFSRGHPLWHMSSILRGRVFFLNMNGICCILYDEEIDVILNLSFMDTQRQSLKEYCGCMHPKRDANEEMTLSCHFCITMGLRDLLKNVFIFFWKCLIREGWGGGELNSIC